MVLKVLRITILAALALGAWTLATDGQQRALAGGTDEPAAPMPYNYYTVPGPGGGVGALLYVAPRPTPPLVGHTYITYEPLLPHEFLYKHSRVYRTCNPGAGWTKTKARWR